MGLTYQDMVTLAAAQPRAEWLHKHAYGTALVHCRLGPVGQAVAGRSGKAWHTRVRQVMAAVGPAQFPQAWLEQMEVWHASMGDMARIGGVAAD
jgi:hypothetical protein